MCRGQPWLQLLLLMAAMSSFWLIKHPLRSGSHGGWCNLSSGSCVMECRLLQSLSLRVINSAVASKVWKDTAHAVASQNQIEFAFGNQTGISVISPWTEHYHFYPDSTTCSKSLNVLPAVAISRGTVQNLTLYTGNHLGPTPNPHQLPLMMTQHPVRAK